MKNTNRTYTDLERSQPRDWDDIHNEFQKLVEDKGLKDNSENFKVWISQHFNIPQVK